MRAISFGPEPSLDPQVEANFPLHNGCAKAVANLYLGQTSINTKALWSGGTGWKRGLLVVSWFQVSWVGVCKFQAVNPLRISVWVRRGGPTLSDSLRKDLIFHRQRTVCVAWSRVMCSLEGKNTKGVCPHRHPHDLFCYIVPLYPACDICPTKKIIQRL